MRAQHEESAAPVPREGPNALQLFTAIGSPIALATALLLYFGWVRSQAQAAAFGADVSIFDMAPQDLVLRSVNILFFPIILLLLACLLALRLEPWLRSRPSEFGGILAFAWVLVPIGLILLWLVEPVGYNLLPLFVGLAIGGTAYGILLRRYATDDISPPRLANVALVGALLIATLFWQTERLARLGGEALADDLKHNLADRLPEVTLLSAGRLHIEAPGVSEAGLEGGESSYRFRYEGLYLLQRSGQKYFLVTDGWQRNQGRLLVFSDSESIRIEFGH
jgi:hypothetical protein